MGGSARYGTAPAVVRPDAATLSLPDFYTRGLVPDADGDGGADLLAFRHLSDGPQVVAWFPSALAGTADDAAATLVLDVWEDIESWDQGYVVTSASAIDPDGDGLDESFVFMEPQSDDDYEMAQTGWVFIIPPEAASGSTLMAEAAATVNEADLQLWGAQSVGDLDADGYGDLVGTFRNGSHEEELAVFLGPFAGALGRADAVATLPGYATLRTVEGGDVDGDGAADLLVRAALSSDDEEDYYVLSDPFLWGGLAAARLHVDNTDETDDVELLGLHDVNADGLQDLVGSHVFYAR